MSLPHDFMPLTIASVRRETPEAISVTFDVPAPLSSKFDFRPGQHINVRATLDGEEARRSYSICSLPGERLRIAIKRVPGGHFSPWANDTLKPGATIDVMPPQGRFALSPSTGEARHVLAFAAGSGITPVIAITAHVLMNEPKSRMTLVYGNRTLDDIMFRQTLEDLKDRYVDRFTLVHILSRGGGEDGAMLEGRITAERVRQLAGRLLPLSEISEAYVCGPGSMIKDVRNVLLSLGLARERVHHEFFAPGGGAYRTPPSPTRVSAATSGEHWQPAGVAGTVEIEAILDGTRHRFVAAPHETVVDAALRAGVRAPYSCKGGMCCTCRARIIEGSASMQENYSLEPWEIAQGFVLTCQSVPTTARLVVDFDQM